MSSDSPTNCIAFQGPQLYNLNSDVRKIGLSSAT